MAIINSNNQIVPEMQRINPVRGGNAQRAVQTANSGFGEIFQGKIFENEKLQFSKHANMRLNARQIQLSSDQLKRVEDGVMKAYKKGVNDSLVLVDDIALVVNIKNKVVVTAMDKSRNSDDSVFTNIDGAVIV